MDWQETLSPPCPPSTEESSESGLLPKSGTDGRLAELPATPITDQSPEERLEEQRGMFFTVVQALRHAINDSSNDVMYFWSGYGGLYDQIVDNRHGNMLHFLVVLINWEPHLLSRAKPIIERLVKQFPGLLVGQNFDGYNPLHMAIRDSSYELFRFIASLCGRDESRNWPDIKGNFTRALAQTCSTANRTALHTYFKNTESLDLRTAKVLIEHVWGYQLITQDADGNTPMHYAASFYHCTLEGLEVIRILIDLDERAIRDEINSSRTSLLDMRNTKGLSVYQSLVQSTDDERLRRKQESQSEYSLRENIFQEMLLLLKKHYMRTRGRQKTTSILYGDNVDDIEISFHYDGLPTTLKWQDFTDRFGQDSTSGIKLDNVLQSVSFPRIDIDVDDQGESNGEHPPRDDMTHMFRWLHAKGVRHIISLSVDDCGGPETKVHTSEAIQKCLRQFTIERLDWQRTDMALEDIHEAISQWQAANSPTDKYPLQDLHLRWSGNIVALHSWSRREGLPKFRNLVKVCLYKPERHKMRGDEARMEQAIKQFQYELVNSHLEVIVEETVTTSHNRRESQLPPIPRDFDWGSSCGAKLRQHLESASEFSEPLKDEWRHFSALFREKSSSTAGDDVVVAVIGDGVDIMDDALHNQCLIGKSFDYEGDYDGCEDGDLNEGFMSPFVSGSDGTVMANLILHVCPMAKIYPIRLPNNDLWFDEDALAKGIEAALAKKATIISVPRRRAVTLTTRHIPGSERLTRALKRAHQEKVLMFFSSNTIEDLQGYPEGVLFIDDDCGNGDERLLNSGQYFVFPGLDSLLDMARSSMSETGFVEGFTKRFVDFRSSSSNSVSTALATGLAAVIIYMVKLGVVSSHLRQDGEDVMTSVEFREISAETITQPDAMAHVFRRLCPDSSSPDLGQVWHSLSRMKRELSPGVGMSRQRILSAVTYQLLLDYRRRSM